MFSVLKDENWRNFKFAKSFLGHFSFSRSKYFHLLIAQMEGYVSLIG